MAGRWGLGVSMVDVGERIARVGGGPNRRQPGKGAQYRVYPRSGAVQGVSGEGGAIQRVAREGLQYSA